jgi:putative hemolysin
MEFSSTIGVAAVFVLVLANGFFVATEFAIVAVRKSRLDQLVEEGRAGAAAAKAVVTHLDSYIAATQFGITLASLALGWIGEPALAHLLEPPLAVVIGGFAPTAAHGVAIGVAFSLITGLHIVIGELAPKGLALQRPEVTSLWVARPIQVFHAVFKWPITMLNAVGNWCLRICGLEPASGHEMVHSVEELRLLVTGMQAAGVVDVTEARIARRAFAFGDLTAGSLMTHRTDMEAVPMTATLLEVFQVAEATAHSRLPVYEGSLDHVVGILHVRELFKYRTTPPLDFSLHSIIRPPLLVPETQYAADLLESMRASRNQLAVVVDEYGGTAGLVTLEDLLEALVGRFDDVRPAESGNRLEGTFEPDGSMLLDGLTRVKEFEEAAGIRLADEAYEGIDTVGGLFPAILGRFPAVGEEIVVEGRTLRVEARDGLRVSTVRLLPPQA